MVGQSKEGGPPPNPRSPHRPKPSSTSGEATPPVRINQNKSPKGFRDACGIPPAAGTHLSALQTSPLQQKASPDAAASARRTTLQYITSPASSKPKGQTVPAGKLPGSPKLAAAPRLSSPASKIMIIANASKTDTAPPSEKALPSPERKKAKLSEPKLLPGPEGLQKLFGNYKVCLLFMHLLTSIILSDCFNLYKDNHLCTLG
jgi:hypothetical protein